MALTQTKSTGLIGQHAVVIGASMAGLLAARVLSERYERVTLIERDRLTEMEARKGVPQGRQTHAILSKGAQVIAELFPDLFPALLEGGATRVDMGADLRWYQYGQWKVQFESGIRVYCESRPWLEEQIRQRVASRTNVRVLDGYEVTRLNTSDYYRRISGVQVRAVDGARREEELMADLVVDASGRGSQAPQWLRVLGCGQVEETAVKVDVGYATRLYRRPERAPADWKILIIFCTPPQEKRIGVLLPIEGDRWSVSVSGWLKAYPPSDEAGFLEYVRSLPNPALYELIKDAEPLSPVSTYRFAANRRRYYERMSTLPEGFLVMGDAVCSFNPIYGQGMTVAAIEAETLQDCLQRRLRRQGDMAGFTRQFQKAIARAINTAWMFATSEDFRYPETEGERPFGLRCFHWYSRRLLEAAADNPRLAQSFYQVMHMLKPPTAMFTPRVLAGVLFWKRPVQPIQEEHLALPKAPGEAEERAAEREPVGAAQR
jgi:2-polyprenyl-6-methoxyphenol hydroxylase-like FAD-dependent oxidoreductase